MAAAGHLGGLDTPLSGGAGGGGVSGYRACSQDPPAHPPGGGGPFPGSKVFLTQRAAPAVFRPREEGLERPGQQPEDQELMAALKATRLQLARQEEVPLYVIFSNATLADMARCRPQTMEEFLSVSGCGRGQGPEVWRGLSGGFGPGGEGGGMTA